MPREIIGNKEIFAIEYQTYDAHPLWGGFVIWLKNKSFGELDAHIDSHLGSLLLDLSGLITNKSHLFDPSFIAKTDNQIFDIISNALFNRDLLEIESRQLISNLGKTYYKYIFGGHPSLDDFLFICLYDKSSNQYKFLIKQHDGDDGYKNEFYIYNIAEVEFEKVVNDYSKKVEKYRPSE